MAFPTDGWLMVHTDFLIVYFALYFDLLCFVVYIPVYKCDLPQIYCK